MNTNNWNLSEIWWRVSIYICRTPDAVCWCISSLICVVIIYSYTVVYVVVCLLSMMCLIGIKVQHFKHSYLLFKENYGGGILLYESCTLHIRSSIPNNGVTHRLTHNTELFYKKCQPSWNIFRFYTGHHLFRGSLLSNILLNSHCKDSFHSSRQNFFERKRYLEESPDRALLRTSGVSSGGTGTSGSPESTLDSLSDTPSFSTFSSLSEPW